MGNHVPRDPDAICRVLSSLPASTDPGLARNAKNIVTAELGALLDPVSAGKLGELLDTPRIACPTGSNLPTIANCGLLKAGKSSLFNALADAGDDREIFATGAARTTKKSQHQECPFGILVDTPGIDATEADQKEAERTLRCADHVLFVHSVQAGELDIVEIDFLKRLSDFFPDRREFASRVIPVFSKGDTVPVGDCRRLGQKALETWETVTGTAPERWFVSSVPRYQHSRRASEYDARRGTWLAMSGIGAVRSFLEDRHREHARSKTSLRRKRALALTDQLLEIVSSCLARSEERHEALLTRLSETSSRRRQGIRELMASLRSLPESY